MAPAAWSRLCLGATGSLPDWGKQSGAKPNPHQPRGVPMCKHVLNAQVSIRAPCCKQWFDCPECHKENTDHELKKSVEIVMACKKCKKCFRKDTSAFEESDEFCPNCDNHFVIEAKSKVKPAGAPVMVIEGGREEIADGRTKEAARFQQSLFANV